MSFSTTLREGVFPSGKKEAMNNVAEDFGKNMETGGQNTPANKWVGFTFCSLDIWHSPPFHSRISHLTPYCIVLFIHISSIQVEYPMSTVNTCNMSTDVPNEENLTFLYYSKEMTV